MFLLVIFSLEMREVEHGTVFKNPFKPLVTGFSSREDDGAYARDQRFLNLRESSSEENGPVIWESLAERYGLDDDGLGF